MEAKAGEFVWAKIAFAEGDGRYKIRPVMVIARARMPNGGIAYIGAGKYSADWKVKGGVEVVLDHEEGCLVGTDHSGVLRFSKTSLVTFRDCDIESVVGSYLALPALKIESIQHAVKSIGFHL